MKAKLITLLGFIFAGLLVGVVTTFVFRGDFGFLIIIAVLVAYVAFPLLVLALLAGSLGLYLAPKPLRWLATLSLGCAILIGLQVPFISVSYTHLTLPTN